MALPGSVIVDSLPKTSPLAAHEGPAGAVVAGRDDRHHPGPHQQVQLAAERALPGGELVGVPVAADGQVHPVDEQLAAVGVERADLGERLR